ncbi:MAG: aldo/keto reductase [Elusimicrobia bacterium]|nr:aldo/keto reductase [Elusimicrobiota bacterium]
MTVGLSNFVKPLQAIGDSLPSQPVSMPTRPLGRTGFKATLFALGGEGILRTHRRWTEAIPVIQKALELGVNYFDTAPAYAQSQDYYGAVLKEHRKRIFLASKTHDRSREGSLRLLEDSLKRLKTDHLDLWQLHDLRTQQDLNQIFAGGGALEALEAARTQKLVRFLGITGHYDPAILLEAIRRYPFDTVLCPVNAGDRRFLSFIDMVLPQAQAKGLGIIGMKVTGRNALLTGLGQGPLSMRDALYYALSQTVSTVIVGCRTLDEVEENVHLARAFTALTPQALGRIEAAALNRAELANSFKEGGHRL